MKVITKMLGNVKMYFSGAVPHTSPKGRIVSRPTWSQDMDNAMTYADDDRLLERVARRVHGDIETLAVEPEDSEPSISSVVQYGLWDKGWLPQGAGASIDEVKAALAAHDAAYPDLAAQNKVSLLQQFGPKK